MILDPSGEVGTTIELDDKAAKKSSGRRSLRYVLSMVSAGSGSR
jgi:hypothetical protein